MSTFSSQAETIAEKVKARNVQSSSNSLSPHVHGEQELTKTWMRTIKLLSNTEARANAIQSMAREVRLLSGIEKWMNRWTDGRCGSEVGEFY